MSTTNHIWNELGSNSGFYGERPGTNGLSLGTAAPDFRTTIVDEQEFMSTKRSLTFQVENVSALVCSSDCNRQHFHWPIITEFHFRGQGHMPSPFTECTLHEDFVLCRGLQRKRRVTDQAALPTETLIRPRLLHNDTHCHLAYVRVTLMVTVIIRFYMR